MIPFDPTLLSALVYPLLKLGVTFGEKFLNTKRNQKTIANDRKAAWDLYIEMVTRITTQPLDPEHGDEKTALDSVYSLFQTTREILLAQGPDCVEFAQIAIVILNQEVRPFTAKWHRKSLAGAFNNDADCTDFRQELETLQEILRAYMRTLAVLAGIEDITYLSQEE